MREQARLLNAWEAAFAGVEVSRELVVVDRAAHVIARGGVAQVDVLHASVVEHDGVYLAARGDEDLRVLLALGLSLTSDVGGQVGVLHSFEQALPLLGTHQLLEFSLGEDAVEVGHEFFRRVVVLAGRHQGALWTPVVQEHVSLQVHGLSGQLLKALLLHQLPHLLLRHLVALRSQLLLVGVQPLPIVVLLVLTDNLVQREQLL